MYEKKRVGIIGGGLVGAMCACYMANRNYEVVLYEKRDDLRKCETETGKSINLALSNRGRNALKSIGLEDIILKNSVAMKGRLLHDYKGETKFIPYDVIGKQCLYSISRNNLNQILLNAISSKKNVELNFNSELISTNQNGSVSIKTQNGIITKSFDLIIGADGAHSALRNQQNNLFSFSQTYIEHGYVELKIESRKSEEMIPNCLHIWPRNDFMMIALPNFDSSWTVTLFMPFQMFDNLKNGDDWMEFFKLQFKDTINLLGESQIGNLSNLKPRSLISINCKSYFSGKHYLLIGDAAHAMVPFYGQGMNAGFEDCYLFDRVLTKNNDDFIKSIKEFSGERIKDGHAICELAMYNYKEMRHLVTKDSYRLRKNFDEFLYRYFPNFWIPLYISVTFTNMPYCNCVINRKWQDKIIKIALFLIIVIIGILLKFLF
ncbi:kynurenine 3-monooxygenase [Onthophagus taurus]|uniref:kynurenine 3-monooxygenase n=1 Tax=Onthophagus taurus TaxID=166361 RepID=UPI0039BDDC01